MKKILALVMFAILSIGTAFAVSRDQIFWNVKEVNGVNIYPASSALVNDFVEVKTGFFGQTSGGSSLTLVMLKDGQPYTNFQGTILSSGGSSCQTIFSFTPTAPGVYDCYVVEFSTNTFVNTGIITVH